MFNRSKVKAHTPTERLLFAVALVLAVVIVGTMGFCILEKRPLLESLFFTLITISTLGMKADYMTDISATGQVWIMILIVIGIASAMIAMSIVVSLVVEGQMRIILGRRTVHNKIASLSNHFIIAGYGRMGSLICQHLMHRNAALVVIDQDSHNTAQAEQDGFLYVLGDANDEEILKAAGIERAKGFVAALSTDAENVFVTLVARDLNSKLFIAARAERIDSEARLCRAGANKAICPQMIGARRLANILTRPGVVDFVDFATEGLNLEAEQYKIESNSKLIGQSLRQANLPREVGILVVGMKTAGGKVIFNPNPDIVMQVNDTMIVIGQSGSMAKLEELFS
ncbi:MAG: potassium channel protein [Sedimentisphaerales bacterium]|nr:potassium channel protein [Sedimentisphaerales bacterium]